MSGDVRPVAAVTLAPLICGQISRDKDMLYPTRIDLWVYTRALSSAITEYSSSALPP